MYDNVLIATDGSDHAMNAADHAIAIAEHFDATLHVLSVIDTRDLGVTTPAELDIEMLRNTFREQSERAIDDVVEKIAEQDVAVVTEIEIGVPSRTIHQYVDDHDLDLVVMGTHGRSSVSRAILGSVTDHVLRTSSAPLLAVRPSQRFSNGTGP